MSPRPGPRLLAFVACAALLPAAPSAGAGIPASFYTSAPKKVPSHGKLIRSMRIRGGSLPALGRSYAVLYSSRLPNGTDVPTSGVVTIPGRKPPRGGYPVVSWAHGTSGIADVCAPSRHVTQAPTNDYVRSFRSQVTSWLKKGYAVAQTDYQGLGTPGLHPYLIGASEGRSVIDIVSAARGLDPHVGKRWAAIGHSQGGHAVLWAAALARSYAPGLTLRGAVPVAPASHIGEQAALIDNITGNPFGGLPALIVAGALTQTSIDPATVFSDRAYALYPQIDRVCNDALNAADSFGGIPLSEYFRPGYDRKPLTDLISSNDPEDLTIKVPMLIAQGLKDTTVFPQFTAATVSDLEGRGARITYKTYPDSTHVSVMRDARADEDAFLVKLLGKR